MTQDIACKHLPVLQVAWRKVLDDSMLGDMFVESLKPLDCRKQAPGTWHNVLDALFVVALLLKVCKLHDMYDHVR